MEHIYTDKNRLRIGFFGDGPWAQRSLRQLLENESVQICFIVLRYHQEDKALAEIGRQAQIDVLRHPDINSGEFFQLVEQYGADLFVSMSFNQIFKRKMIDFPPLGTINCHAGKLPFYRGRNILNWALINDEREFGVTVHYVDEGIDTGDIILQRTCPITDADTYATLLERAHEACAELLCAAIARIMDGTAERKRQSEIDPVGMYCGGRGPGDEIIDWSQSSRRIFNFVRAITSPGPGARSYVKGKELIIYASRMIEGARAYINTPGQIIGKTDDGLLVKTGDTFLEITDYRYDGKLFIGDRLKSDRAGESV